MHPNWHTDAELARIVRQDRFVGAGFSVATENGLEAMSRTIVTVRRHSRNPGLPIMAGGALPYPTTPDGRYFVVRGRLWRCSDPGIPEGERGELVAELMAARREKGAAIRAGDIPGREAARARIDAAKTALGERGPPWWNDGAPDLNRRMVSGTPYSDWWTSLPP